MEILNGILASWQNDGREGNVQNEQVSMEAREIVELLGRRNLCQWCLSGLRGIMIGRLGGNGITRQGEESAMDDMKTDGERESVLVHSLIKYILAQ